MSLHKEDRVYHRTMSLLQQQMINPKTGKLYIFGYGSLLWKPNITYSRSWVGYIEGYHRRFYQGTTTHRGTPEWPGRVATLVPARNPRTRVWGITFEVEGLQDINAAIEHLAERELITGGYRFDTVPFVAHKLKFTSLDSTDAIVRDVETALLQFGTQVYIAEPGNSHYVGDATLEVQAAQIAKAVGHCGPNVEYLNYLVDFIKSEVPREDLHFDKYLLDLHDLVSRFTAKSSYHSKEQPLDASQYPLQYELAADNMQTITNPISIDCELTTTSQPIKYQSLNRAA